MNLTKTIMQEIVTHDNIDSTLYLYVLRCNWVPKKKMKKYLLLPPSSATFLPPSCIYVSWLHFFLHCASPCLLPQCPSSDTSCDRSLFLSLSVSLFLWVRAGALSSRSLTDISLSHHSLSLSLTLPSNLFLSHPISFSLTVPFAFRVII